MKLIATDSNNNKYDITIEGNGKKSCTFYVNQDESTRIYSKANTQLFIICKDFIFEDMIPMFEFFETINKLKLNNIRVETTIETDIPVLLFDADMANYKVGNVYMFDYFDEKAPGNEPSQGLKYAFELFYNREG